MTCSMGSMSCAMTMSAAFLDSMFDETSEVSLGSDVLACSRAEFQNTKRETMTRQRTDTKVLGISLEQRVRLRLGSLARTKRSGGVFLASFGFEFGLVIETK